MKNRSLNVSKQQDEWILTEMVSDCDRNCDLGQWPPRGLHCNVTCDGSCTSWRPRYSVVSYWIWQKSVFFFFFFFLRQIFFSRFLKNYWTGLIWNFQDIFITWWRIADTSNFLTLTYDLDLHEVICMKTRFGLQHNNYLTRDFRFWYVVAKLMAILARIISPNFSKITIWGSNRSLRKQTFWQKSLWLHYIDLSSIYLLFRKIGSTDYLKFGTCWGHMSSSIGDCIDLGLMTLTLARLFRSMYSFARTNTLLAFPQWVWITELRNLPEMFTSIDYSK